MSNLSGLLITVAYIFAIIGVAEWLRRAHSYSATLTRKLVHIGVGMSIWFVPFIFETPWPFIATCGAFAVINWLDWRYGLFPAMGIEDQTNLGTVYFPIATALVTYIFWSQPPLMVAALMPLTWGDGLAAIVGRRLGRHFTPLKGTPALGRDR